jgi:hypothetical protein
LGVAFELEEVAPAVVVVEEPAGVVGAVDDVKERQELWEVGAECFPAGVPRAGIKHVDDV